MCNVSRSGGLVWGLVSLGFGKVVFLMYTMRKVHFALGFLVRELQLCVHRGVGFGLVWGWFCLVSYGFRYMFKECHAVMYRCVCVEGVWGWFG